MFCKSRLVFYYYWHGIQCGIIRNCSQVSCQLVPLSPAAKGGDPKFSDLVFFSADYLSLGHT